MLNIDYNMTWITKSLREQWRDGKLPLRFDASHWFDSTVEEVIQIFRNNNARVIRFSNIKIEGSTKPGRIEDPEGKVLGFYPGEILHILED